MSDIGSKLEKRKEHITVSEDDSLRMEYEFGAYKKEYATKVADLEKERDALAWQLTLTMKEAEEAKKVGKQCSEAMSFKMQEVDSLIKKNTLLEDKLKDSDESLIFLQQKVHRFEQERDSFKEIYRDINNVEQKAVLGSSAAVELLATSLVTTNQLQEGNVPTEGSTRGNIKNRDDARAFLESVKLESTSLGTLEKINTYLVEGEEASLTKYYICFFASEVFAENNEVHMAVHFLNSAVGFVDFEVGIDSSPYFYELALKALNLKRGELALDFFVKSICNSPRIEKKEQNILSLAYENVRAASAKKQQHGHDLLIDHLTDRSSQLCNSERAYTLVEVGTTREDIPGQGSTLLLAELCQKIGVEFITVDMDPNNSLLAKSLFASRGINAQAVNQKGEDFLRDFQGNLDFAFLDAYDFDHGMHSDLRQARYKKYLGAAIDEQECHKMHLDCAKSIVEKLSKDGVICIDDTWTDEKGNWAAKGTTAVPFLLNNGFEILDARNRAVLMKRKSND